MHVAGEDDVQGINKCIRRRWKLQRWYIGRRLCEVNAVADECFLLRGRVATTAKADLFPAAPAQGNQHLGRLRCLADVRSLSPNPVVVRTSIQRHLRVLRGDVSQTIPARENKTVLIADAGTRWSCRLRRRITGGACSLRGPAALHRHAAGMQKPAPLIVLRVLDTAGMQLLWWNERPALRITLHVQPFMDLLW